MRHLFLLLLLLAGLPALAQEAAKRPTVIVVDSSGSMAAQLDGTVKLDAARQVLGELLGKWPLDAPLALVAYGHRRTGDCRDIEVLAPLGPPDPTGAVRRLQELRARGKTPLAASLQLAATLLPDGGGSIILVTDGLETCDADPCAVAAALHQAGATVQVVGFGVTKEEAAGLACIAEAAGGSYHTAADADSLLDSLGQAAEAALTVEPQVSEPASSPPVEPEPPGPQAVAFTAVYTGGERQLEEPVRWQVIALGDTPAFDYSGEGRGLALELAPGRYRVIGSAANAQHSLELEVGAEPMTVSLPLAVGRLTATAVTAKGRPPLTEADGPRWGLEPLDGQAAVPAPAAAQPALLLAAGRYRLDLSVGDWSNSVEVTIASGATAQVAVSLALGGLTLEAALDDTTPAITEWRGLDWHVYGAGGDAEYARRDGEAQPHLLLPAGSYRIELRAAGGSLEGKATVQEGGEARARLLVPSANYTLTAALAPGAELLTDWRDSIWTVTALDVIGLAPDSTVMELQPANNPELQLLPGHWRVTLQSGLATTEGEIQAVPGDSGSLRFDLAAARLTIAAAAAPGKIEPLNIVFEVAALAADGSLGDRVALGGSSQEIETILPAGAWRVFAADDQGRQAEQDVTLAPGANQSLTLQLE